MIDSDFINHEIETAIKNLKPSKAPGPDGFSGHYYRKYLDLLVPHLFSFFNNLKKVSLLPSHENVAFTHVIPKLGKDHSNCENFRPILLIDVDLKILNNVLATRLNSFLSQYINPDQVGFVPTRQALNQTRRLKNIISALCSNWDNYGIRKGMLLGHIQYTHCKNYCKRL